ncbi:MAG TPA: LCP family protein [Rubrobacter sp.]|nr:LCP family protein [Rubrobacter sp.]
MRSFQTNTRERRGVRRLWLWLLPVVSVALVVGVVLAAGPLSLTTLGNRTGQDASGSEDSTGSWIDRVFGGGGPLAEGPLNVLVLGVDTRPDDPAMGSRTDTIMLVQVVPKTGDVKLLSVPRDLYIEVGSGQKDRINAAYNYGGIEQTVDAMEGYTGVTIDHYAIVDFEGFREVIDAMDGVRVDVGQDVFPEKWHMGEGVQRLGGRKALFYARYRGTAGGDLDRMERQRRLVAALRSKALQWNIIEKLPATMKVMNENVQTDLDLDSSVALGQVLIRRGKHAEVTSEQLQGTPRTLPDGAEVLIPDDDENKLILAEFR